MSCPLCGRRYQHTKARNRHLLSAHPEECRRRGWRKQCASCPMAFTSASGLERHRQKVHGGRRGDPPIGDRAAAAEGEEAFHCPFGHPGGTRVAVRDLKELKVHVREAHKDKDRCCVVCGQECASREDVLEHIQVIIFPH